MTNLLKLSAFGDDGVLVVVETPRGSRAKLDYNPALKTFTLSKALLAGLTYPYDWGFVPATTCEDGDPLDVTVMASFASPALLHFYRKTQRGRRILPSSQPTASATSAVV
jgi:inorganic pyrophosphatase